VQFDENSPEGCQIHPGYLKKQFYSDEGLWTCCKEQGLHSRPCLEHQHKTAVWPDPLAQLYFIKINRALDHKSNNISDGIISSGYFYQTQPYHEYQNKDRIKLLQMYPPINDPIF
jgi:hypothetical protein